MRRRLSALAAVTLALACGDQPLSDEPLLGPVVSPAAPQGTGNNIAEGNPHGGGPMALGPAFPDEVELYLSEGGTTTSDHTQLVLANPANSGTTDWTWSVNSAGTYPGELMLSGPGGTELRIKYDTSIWIISSSVSVNSRLSVGNLIHVGPNTLCADAEGGSFIGRCTSSLRYKQDVEDLDRGLATVLQLTPRMFRWKGDSGTVGSDDLGFIAEEVAVLDPLLATFDEEGAPSGVKYRHMTALLTQGIQELSQTVERQSEEIAELKALVTELLQNTNSQHGQDQGGAQ